MMESDIDLIYPEETMSLAQLQSLVSRRDLFKIGIAGLAAALGLLDTNVAEALPSLQNNVKRIYIAPDDHTDYFWAANETTYRDVFLRMLDYYLDLTDNTANLPADFQSRWNCDGSFWLWTYQTNRTPQQFEQLINRIRDGHMSAPLNALVVCLGGAPAEAVLRGMYYAGQLERRHNLRFRIAISMENQTLPLGLASLWYGAGARYSWKGICGCDTLVAAADREHEIYYMTGLDNSRILMKWNSRLIDNQGIGGYAEAFNPAAIVEYVDNDGGFIARYPYQVIGAFGHGWDAVETLTDEFVTVAQQKTNSTRRVIVSNQEDFFIDFETTYGATLPSVMRSFGNDWDLYCAALAEVSAKIKRSTERLRLAEALATLVTLTDNTFMNGRETDRDRAWMNLGLFWEHNFGVAGVDIYLQERIAWQRRLATELHDYVEQLYSDAGTRLSTLIATAHSQGCFWVFNPLSWERTDVADLPYSGSTARVTDLTTGQEVPSQIMTNGSTTTLRILASAVPPVGYKVFRVENVAPTLLANAATFAGGVFQNARYRLTVNSRGAITSLVDPTRENREFAQTINGRAINDLGSSTGTLVVESAGPVSVTLLATAAAPLSHRTRITLFRDIDRIDIQNEILQNFNDTYTWAFSFNLSSPDVWHEEVGAVIRARLQANGGHYSPRNANYSWLTLNHFADMTGSTGHGITLSNADCYFMRLGNSTLDTLDTTTPQINVLAGGRVGGDGRFGIPNQGGDDYFLQRFALRTRASYDPVSAMRFALEHQNPLVAGSVIGTNPLYPESNYSFLTIDNPSVLLWALKPADDNSHVIARLWNLSGSAGNIGLTFPQHSVSDAQVTTHIETPLGNAAVNNGQLEEGIIGQQMRTFSLNLGTDGSACVPQNSAISDQELLVALQAVTDAPLSISLVVFTQTGMNIYANSSGMTGVALFNVRNAEGYITLELSSVITPTGAPAPTSLAQAISAHLPGIVVQALDTLLSARYGSNFNLESVQIHQNVMDVCVRT